MKALKFFTLMLFCGCHVLRAQEPKQIVQQAVASELTADRNDHSHWIFHEVDRKPKNSVVQWVAETGKGDVTRVLIRNGRPIPSAQQTQPSRNLSMTRMRRRSNARQTGMTINRRPL